MLIDRDMKKRKYFILFYVLLTIGMVGCKEDDVEIGEPFSQVEGLTATEWVVEQVFLIDESNPARPERDVSKYYITSENRMMMSYSPDYTFEVTAGEGLNFFPPSGTWMFDSNGAPTKIILTSQEGVMDAPLDGPTRAQDNQLKIQIVSEYCQVDGQSKPTLGYRLVFNRK